MTPDAIRGEVQLLVEGNDERNFFAAFTEHLQLPNVEIQAFGGKDRLREFLETLAGATDFKQVKRIGIVRDADASADAAFRSVQTSLRNANAGIRSSGAEFPVPDRPEQLVGEQPALSVMVLPGDGQAGMLETCCAGPSPATTWIAASTGSSNAPRSREPTFDGPTRLVRERIWRRRRTRTCRWGWRRRGTDGT